MWTRPTGLVGGAAAGPGDPGDRDREADVGPRQGALGHRPRDLLADRADPLEQLGRHAEQLLLGAVVVGDVAALDHVGRARDLGQAGGDQAAGAGFGGGEAQPARLAGGEQPSRQLEARSGEDHGSSQLTRIASTPPA